MARQVLENGVILPAEYSDDWYDDMTSNLTKLDDVIGSDSEKLSSADVGAAALSNDYNDLDNLPTIPTVNDATLTIQKNGVDVQTFTANASSNVTANITVPTKTSDLTNDSNFVDTSNSAVSSGITSAKVTDYDTHIADTDKHVTTADKNKWNNQTYVFRYSSTTLVASSTNSNALLDNTDNLKVGDKVIDSNGVLFSITAIDTANSTFTVGTALIDLAQDSDVVHKSGDETIGGKKTFSENITCFSNSDAKSIICKTPLSTYDSTNTVGDNTKIRFLDKNNNSISYIMQRKLTNGNTDLSLNISNTDSNNQPIEASLIFALDSANEPRLSPGIDNTISIGRPVFRYKSVYATEYYYGSNNVEFSTKFVTTDTAQTISGTKTFDGVDINLKSNNAEYSITGGYKDIFFLDKNSTRLAYFRQGVYSSGLSYQTFNILGYNSSNQQISQSITFSSGNLGLSTAFLRANTDNVISLGDSTHKWSDVQTYKVNNLEPSSLSLPSGNANDVIDISSYLVNLDGTDNTYVAPANGWITINMNNCSGIHATITGFWGDSRVRASAGAVKFLMPVLKNQTVTLTIHGGTIDNARFIPCQGNV